MLDELLETISERRKQESQLIPRDFANFIRVKHGFLDEVKRTDSEAAEYLGITLEEFQEKLYVAYRMIRELQGFLPVPRIEPKNAKSVFISYSWDTEEHKSWVRKLAERMVLKGIDVRLDQWHVRGGESFTLFMEKSISESDFVVCVFTPNYAEKANNREAISGVGYEQQIISGQIMAGIPRTKFIPVIRNGKYQRGPNCAIPAHFLGIACEDFRNDADYECSIEFLLRIIHGKPKYVAPEIGRVPRFEA